MHYINTPFYFVKRRRKKITTNKMEALENFNLAWKNTSVVNSSAIKLHRKIRNDLSAVTEKNKTQFSQFPQGMTTYIQ